MRKEDAHLFTNYLSYTTSLYLVMISFIRTVLCLFRGILVAEGRWEEKNKSICR